MIAGWRRNAVVVGAIAYYQASVPDARR